jgi:insertion element IS1 protein InsB
MDFVVGNRSTKTGLTLWNRIVHQSCGIVATDYWKSYNKMIPAEKLLQTKAETYTVESYNAQIRHFLARFRRKTKCYSKSVEMMIYSLKLLIFLGKFPAACGGICIFDHDKEYLYT